MKINYLIRFLSYKSLIFSALLLSCCHALNSESQKFLSIMKELGAELVNNKTYYLLIPVDGCNACVEKSIKFAKNHKHKQNLRVVLVSNHGYKNAALRYGENLPSHYVIDSKGKLINGGYVDGYVSMIEISGGAISLKKNFSPGDIDVELLKLGKLL